MISAWCLRKDTNPNRSWSNPRSLAYNSVPVSEATGVFAAVWGAAWPSWSAGARSPGDARAVPRSDMGFSWAGQERVGVHLATRRRYRETRRGEPPCVGCDPCGPFFSGCTGVGACQLTLVLVTSFAQRLCEHVVVAVASRQEEPGLAWGSPRSPTRQRGWKL